MKCRSRLLVFLPLLFPALCLADFSGRVVRVVDGDTVQVLTDGKMVKVRLNGIDAPESEQPFGQRSKQNLLKRVWHGLIAIMAVPVTKQCYTLKKKPGGIESGCGRHLIQWSRGNGANRINRIIFFYNPH